MLSTTDDNPMIKPVTDVSNNFIDGTDGYDFYGDPTTGPLMRCENLKDKKGVPLSTKAKETLGALFQKNDLTGTEDGLVTQFIRNYLKAQAPQFVELKLSAEDIRSYVRNQYDFFINYAQKIIDNDPVVKNKILLPNLSDELARELNQVLKNISKISSLNKELTQTEKKDQKLSRRYKKLNTVYQQIGQEIKDEVKHLNPDSLAAAALAMSVEKLRLRIDLLKTEIARFKTKAKKEDSWHYRKLLAELNQFVINLEQQLLTFYTTSYLSPQSGLFTKDGGIREQGAFLQKAIDDVKKKEDVPSPSELGSSPLSSSSEEQTPSPISISPPQPTKYISFGEPEDEEAKDDSLGNKVENMFYPTPNKLKQVDLGTILAFIKKYVETGIKTGYIQSHQEAQKIIDQLFGNFENGEGFLGYFNRLVKEKADIEKTQKELDEALQFFIINPRATRDEMEKALDKFGVLFYKIPPKVVAVVVPPTPSATSQRRASFTFSSNPLLKDDLDDLDLDLDSKVTNPSSPVSTSRSIFFSTSHRRDVSTSISRRSKSARPSGHSLWEKLGALSPRRKEKEKEKEKTLNKTKSFD